jgi:hypothetical protein
MWQSIRNPFLLWAASTVVLIVVILLIPVIPPPPVTTPPSCGVVKVTYRHPCVHGMVTYQREEVQCPGPGEKVWVKRVSVADN